MTWQGIPRFFLSSPRLKEELPVCGGELVEPKRIFVDISISGDMVATWKHASVHANRV